MGDPHLEGIRASGEDNKSENEGGGDTNESPDVSVYLYDPENGRTSQAFMKYVKKYLRDRIDIINYGDRNIDTKTPLLLVVVVRCTTVRFEDDFDAALEMTLEKTSMKPDVLIYFHMDKHLTDATDTEKRTLSKDKYKSMKIIDMEYHTSSSNKGVGVISSFVNALFKPQVNTQAKDELMKTLNDLKRSVHEAKLFVDDKMRTKNEESGERLIAKLESELLQIEQVDSGKESFIRLPLAIIQDEDCHCSGGDSKLEGVDTSNIVLLRLLKCKGKGKSDNPGQKTTTVQFGCIIDIDINLLDKKEECAESDDEEIRRVGVKLNNFVRHYNRAVKHNASVKDK